MFKGAHSGLMSFSSASMTSWAPVWLSGLVCTLGVEDATATVYVTQQAVPGSSCPQWTSPVAHGKTGPDQGVNFQCIKNCPVRQARLTCTMGVLEVRLWTDARSEETAAGLGQGVWGARPLAWSVVDPPLPIPSILPPSPKRCLHTHTRTRTRLQSLLIGSLLGVQNLVSLVIRKKHRLGGQKSVGQSYCACEGAWERCTINHEPSMDFFSSTLSCYIHSQ